MTLRKNLVVGVISSAWVALIGIAVIPQYLKYLGVEAYGLIGFFVTTQALLQLLDMGMAPTVNREIARSSISGKVDDAKNLLHTLAIVYWGIAVIIALSLLLLAPSIAGYWLKSEQLRHEEISHAVMLMGLVVACRWPISLYQAAVIGAQRLAVSSLINIVMATIGSLGAVVVLSYVSPTIGAFFIWQAIVGIIYAATMRLAAWRVLGGNKGRRFDVDILKRVWRFSAGMGAIAISSVVFTQMDKVILSKILKLEEFGHYMLATVVVSGLYLLVTPVFNIIYPRFSALVVSKDEGALITLYRMGTRILAIALFPIAMLLVLFADELLVLWVGDPDIASSVAPVIAILAIGSVLHGVMYFPYALQLAYGKTRLPLTINIILMFAFVPLMIFCALIYGALGGAIAWCALHVLYLFLGTFLTHRVLLKKIGAIWLFQDVGIPLAASVLIGSAGYYLVDINDYSIGLKLLIGLIMGLLTLVLSLLGSTQLRQEILCRLEWIKK